jgi:uncharacterized protein YutE (UPF0331/DUF86 family)
VRRRGLGAPASSREAFDVLATADLVTPDLVIRLKRMVGFRNVAVHRYTDLDIAVVERVIRVGLNDLSEFVAVALRL